jgi:CRISPR system Cascade subunit CasA
LYGRVLGFFKDQKVDGAKLAAQASQTFWQLCERDFQSLVDGCEQADVRDRLRRRFADYVHQAFDRYCPRDTARQLDAWAKNRPNLSKYLKQEG